MENENDKQTANDATGPVAEVKEDATNEANVEKVYYNFFQTPFTITSLSTC